MKYSGVIVLMDGNLTSYTALPQTFIRALRQIGCPVEVTFFNINIRLYRIIYEFFPWLNKVYLNSDQNDILSTVKKSKCEAVLVVKGVFLLPDTIKKIQAMNKRVYCYNPDDPFQSEFGTSNRNIRACVPVYDGYFIWGRRVMQFIKDAGCDNVFYMPFAVDETIIKSKKDAEKHAQNTMDVSFIGGGNRKRITLIKSLAERLGPKVNITVFGHDWPQVAGVSVNSSVFGEEYLNVMYNSKINLNILREQNEGANNMRTFEIPGTGSFMLHEYSEEAVSFFKEGSEAEFYRNIDECVDKIEEYLKRDSRRTEIAKAGYEKVYKAGYLYTNLMKEMVNRMDLNPSES